jgi:hypothetical protein
VSWGFSVERGDPERSAGTAVSGPPSVGFRFHAEPKARASTDDCIGTVNFTRFFRSD